MKIFFYTSEPIKSHVIDMSADMTSGPFFIDKVPIDPMT